MPRKNGSAVNKVKKGQFLIDRRQFLGAIASSSVALSSAQPAATSRQNVVMIIVDGWRSEMMGCTGNLAAPDWFSGAQGRVQARSRDV